jgi:serine/threonine protein kinase
LGHTDLRTAESRRKAEEVVGKTTTQMFRAPEMVDLYMSKRLTQSTDVWALGCCLYSLAFLRDCFEEGSNLAILSKKYKIPGDNPYGGGVVDLIDRMLTVDYKERADMSEVIMCLSALYSNRELPKRKKRSDKKEGEEEVCKE